MENAEVLMLKSKCIPLKYNYFQALEPLRFPLIGKISQYVVFYLVNLKRNMQKLPKVQCHKAMIWDLKAIKMELYHPNIF